MCVFSACNNSLACQGVCCSRRTGPEEGFQADLATLECAAFQPSTTPSQASPTNPGSDPHTGGLQCTHTREHTKWQLYIFFFKMASWWQVGGILAWAGSHPDTPRLLWRILCTLLCTYLLFIGALPYWQPVPDPIDQWGRSLALLSDTRCRCLKREIKLVGAAAKTHMVAGLAGKENPADFPRGWGMRMSSMGNEGVCKLMTVSEKFVCLFPRWWSLSKGWQTGALAAAFNWVLRREDSRVGIGWSAPWIGSALLRGHLHDFHTNSSLQKSFDMNLLDGTKAYFVILMKMWWIFFPIF